METKIENLVHDAWLARRLKVTKGWLHQQVDQGLLPAVKADGGKGEPVYLFDEPLVMRILLERAGRGER